GLAGITSGPDANLWFTESTAGQIGRVAISADLSVTKTHTPTRVLPGSAITYTIFVANAAGSVPVNGAVVTDTFPTALTGVTWTAVFAGGATGTANGTGNILETINLPAGGTATYTVTATLAPSAGGVVANTVSVNAPAGTPDVNPSNNTATDTVAGVV